LSSNERTPEESKKYWCPDLSKGGLLIVKSDGTTTESLKEAIRDKKEFLEREKQKNIA